MDIRGDFTIFLAALGKLENSSEISELVQLVGQPKAMKNRIVFYQQGVDTEFKKSVLQTIWVHLEPAYRYKTYPGHLFTSLPPIPTREEVRSLLGKPLRVSEERAGSEDLEWDVYGFDEARVNFSYTDGLLSRVTFMAHDLFNR